MTFRKPCGPCHGTGYYRAPSDTCQVCKGIGALELPGDRSDYKSCGPCHGTGYYRMPSDTCQVCRGAGLVPHASVFTTPAKESGAQSPAPSAPPGSSSTTRIPSVFIVHGRNHTVRDQIDLFLTKDLKLRTVIMEAGPHEGRSLAEKFEEMAEGSKFAVFILTADDNLSDHVARKTVKRARQNVILEVGYFWGALRRRGRVAFLVDQDPDMELPSDIESLGWIPITPDLAETKLRLQKELHAAGLI